MLNYLNNILENRSRAKLYSYFYSTDACVSKSGDTMTGNLSAPTISVSDGKVFIEGYTNRSSVWLRNADNTNNAGAISRYHTLDISTELKYERWIDGNISQYNIIHTGNKNLITPADIGAPTVTEFNSLKTSVSEGKSLIATAVTGKGVQTAVDATFQTIATNISSIPTGYTKVSDARSSVVVGGGGNFGIQTPTFANGVIQIRCSGRTPYGNQISGYITITLG